MPFLVVIHAVFLLVNAGWDVSNCVARRMDNLELEPWFLPRFPTVFFFSRVFLASLFWPPSDSSLCKLSRSSVSCYVLLTWM